MLSATLILIVIAIIGVLKLVTQPGHLLPGLEGVQEHVTTTVVIAFGGTTGVLTFALEGNYDAAPAFAPGFKVTGDGAAVKVVDYEITTHTVDEIVMTVTLDADPGGADSNTVTGFVIVSGVATK